MNTRLRALVWDFVSEGLLAALVAATLLTLDCNNVLMHDEVFTGVAGAHDIIEKYLLAGVVGWGVILAVPFLLLQFAGEALKRTILEHEAFLPYVYAYGFTTFVVVTTYFATGPLISWHSIAAYGILVFLVAYSGLALMTALRSALAFLWLVQKMSSLEKDLREGKAGRL